MTVHVNNGEHLPRDILVWIINVLLGIICWYLAFQAEKELGKRR